MCHRQSSIAVWEPAGLCTQQKIHNGARKSQWSGLPLHLSLSDVSVRAAWRGSLSRPLCLSWWPTPSSGPTTSTWVRSLYLPFMSYAGPIAKAFRRAGVVSVVSLLLQGSLTRLLHSASPSSPANFAARSAKWTRFIDVAPFGVASWWHAIWPL